MPCAVVVGAQWGDEAKGKIVDLLAQNADVVVRYNGGPNAGHSVVFNGQTFAQHIIPSGIFNPNTLCIVADGVVLDLEDLAKEMHSLTSRGVSLGNLRISPNAHLILPYHKLLDRLEEERRGRGRIGTTGRGVGPAYADKASRCGLRVGDLLDERRFRASLRQVMELKNLILTRVYGAEPLDPEKIADECFRYAQGILPYVADTTALLRKALLENRKVVFEGAQGTMLDIDYGTYPYVTSSHPVAAGACLGTGVGPREIDLILGVAKAYTTRVGEGAFPTELKDERGDQIRERGHEYGTTTGRPRRCGWLDTVALRYAATVNSLDCIALMCLDVLSGMPEVQICTAYKTKNCETKEFPADRSLLAEAKPVYETLPGWQEDISSATSISELPQNAQNYVARVSELVGVPVEVVSVGPDRRQTIIKDDGAVARFMK
jgi:adenylosuccinate synthase